MGRKKLFEDRAGVILEAAERLFSNYGYDRTTMDDIARTAGLSKASLYLEFKTKEEVLEATINAFFQRETERMEAQAHEEHENIVDAILNMLMAHAQSLMEHGHRHPRPGGPPEPLHNPSLLAEMNRIRTPIFHQQMQRVPRLLEKMLIMAAGRGEILVQKDYPRVANLLFITVMRLSSPPFPPFMPPEMALTAMRDLLEMMLASLKTIRK